MSHLQQPPDETILGQITDFFNGLLREMAAKAGISPAYLSRIERGKERPPKPEIIKKFARILAADPDVLFRLSSSTDPEVVDYLHENPGALHLLRYIKDAHFTDNDINKLLQTAESMNTNIQ